ncbi:MAG TPA: HNH endonuclease family protein, partial [Pseudobdellovibrionaceae bacterium]|nr:HNH endonuclease family protein [Pseudobdellovibrionaceae bacterium]
SVARGRWLDPYTGREFYESRDIQIDHFVPLKNSYISGAWKWDYQKRCLYANFLGNPYHLVAVSGRENMVKSDKAPDRYMPPNSRYNCRYLQQWLKLKMIWDLGLTPPEVSKIRQLVEENNCSSEDLVISSEELLKQRNVIEQNLDLCRPKNTAK